MTERIDLDEMETADEQPDAEETPNRGDWFWKGEGDPDDEPGETSWGAPDDAADGGSEAAPAGADGASEDADADGDATPDATTASDADGSPPAPAAPHVPSDDAGTPAGIPVERGGGGAGSSGSESRSGSTAAAESGDGGDAAAGETRASGPHGGGADDMTTAFTYRAAKRLANPAAAFDEAAQWSDWVGIVGDVDAHVIGAFQRNETIDADFFNGSGTGPAERLADIDPHSMFYADRMVVVGVEGEDEAIAEEAGWEFVSLTEAASGAGWELVSDDADASGAVDADADAETGSSDGADADDADADADDER